MQRTLGGFETAAVLTGEAHALNVVIVLRLAGDVPPARLERALAALQCRHPLLGVRVVGTGRRRRMLAGAPTPLLRVLERGNGASWRAVVERELDRPLDLATGPPLRCVYLPSVDVEGHSEVILTVHHAVIDGASTAPLLAELLTLCNGSKDPVAPGNALPPAADALFPVRYRGWRSGLGRMLFLWRQLTDEARSRWQRARSARPPSETPADCRVLTLALHEGATTTLVRRSRRERATLNGALNAALLLAVQRRLYDGISGPLRYFAFADLRPYLTPAQTAETLAAYVAPLRFTIDLSERGDFWSLARRITHQIAGAGRRGDKFHAASLMPAIMRATLRRRGVRMATAALSYAGALRPAPQNEGLRVRGLHAFVSNLAQGPEFTASVKLVGDRLVWDIVYLAADMGEALARRVAGEIVRTLAREALEPPGAREGGGLT